MFRLVGLLLCCLCVVFTHSVRAAVTWQESKQLRSKSLQEDRFYRVSLPQDYQLNKATQYPLLLILDGQFYGDMVAQNERFLSDVGEIPQHVIVAVDSGNRLRDFTPTDSDDWVGDGGADNFVAFVAHELMPTLEQDYRIGKLKVIWGHSAAGLYVMHHLYSAPTTFDAFLVNDGSLDWDGQVVAKNLKKYLMRDDRPKQFLYFNNSYLMENVPEEFGFIEPLKSILSELADEQLDWQHQNLRDESHGTIPLIGSINGLRTLYEGYRTPESIVYAGLDAIKAYYAKLQGRVGAPDKIPQQGLLDLAFHTLFSKQQGAANVFEFVLSLYPDSMEAWEGLSMVRIEENNTAAAIDALEQAIALAEKADSDELSRLQQQKQALITGQHGQ